MTCGRRVDHRIRRHHPAVLVVTEGAAATVAGAEGVIISLTLEGKRQAGDLVALKATSKQYLIRITVRVFPAFPGEAAAVQLNLETATALHPSLHTVVLDHHFSRPTGEARKVHLKFLTTSSHELLQPWLSRSNRTTPATPEFTIFKAARCITNVFTTQNPASTTT
jgi:hypothetical protein